MSATGGHAMRADAQLIKVLSKAFGPRCGSAWQRPPLVLIPEGWVDEFTESLTGTMEITDPDAQAELLSDRLSPRMPEIPENEGPGWRVPALLETLVFTDAVFQITERGRPSWYRLVALDSVEDVARAQHSQPWLDCDWAERGGVRLGEDVLLTTITDLASMKLDSMLVARSDPWRDVSSVRLLLSFGRRPTAMTIKEVDLRPGGTIAIMDHIRVRLAVAQSLFHHAKLLFGDEVPVEERPTVKQVVKEKTEREKPWLRPLPSIILLDPTAAPSRSSAPASGTHASPRAHQRRGHWRRLVAERFRTRRMVWVRPSWVGPKEWFSQGQTYRVLDVLPEIQAVQEGGAE